MSQTFGLSQVFRVTTDPTVTSLNAPKGAIVEYVPSIGTPTLFQKQDDGDTTNWTPVGGSSDGPGGPTFSVQFFDGSAFDGSDNLTFDGTTLTQTGQVLSPASASTYPVALKFSSSLFAITMGADVNANYIQGWENKPLYLNGQGNPVAVGGVVSPSEQFEVSGNIKASGNVIAAGFQGGGIFAPFQYAINLATNQGIFDSSGTKIIDFVSHSLTTTANTLSIDWEGRQLVNSAGTTGIFIWASLDAGAAGNVLSTDGAGNLSWVDRATTSLNNLASTAVNADIVGSADGAINLGSAGIGYGIVWANTIESSLFNNMLITTQNRTGAAGSITINPGQSLGTGIGIGAPITLSGGIGKVSGGNALLTSGLSFNTSTGTATVQSSDSHAGSSASGGTGDVFLKSGTTTTKSTPPNGSSITGSIHIFSGDSSNTGLSGHLFFTTGATVNGASGNISLSPGLTSGSGTRGKIKIKDGTEGFAGYVLTSIDVDGTTAWMPAGLTYVKKSFSYTDFAVASTTANSLLVTLLPGQVIENVIVRSSTQFQSGSITNINMYVVDRGLESIGNTAPASDFILKTAALQFAMSDTSPLDVFIRLQTDANADQFTDGAFDVYYVLSTYQP